MKILLSVLVFIFSFQLHINAGEVSDFELEGMSIGESALKYFSKEELENHKYGFESKEFAYVSIPEKNLKTYHDGLIIIKPKDKSFIIHSISGRMFFYENVNACHEEQDLIANEFSKTFENVERTKKDVYRYNADKSGKSTVQTINFLFNNGSGAHIGCYNINIEYLERNNMYNSQSNLSVSLNSAEYMDFQRGL